MQIIKPVAGTEVTRGVVHCCLSCFFIVAMVGVVFIVFISMLHTKVINIFNFLASSVQV